MAYRYYAEPVGPGQDCDSDTPDDGAPQAPCIRLNIGVGQQCYHGYTGLDIHPGPSVDIVYDMNDPLPFEDGTVDEILCVHTLEHIEQWKVPYVLKEWHRVLKHDGVAWGRVPDTGAYVAVFLDALRSGDRYVEERCLDALLGATRSNPHAQRYEAHHAAFTAATLREALINGGFENILIRSMSEGKLDYVLVFVVDKHAAPFFTYPSVEVYR